MSGPPAEAAARPRSLAWLPAFLLHRDAVPARFVLKAWALALVPSLLLSGLVGLLIPAAKGPDFSFAGPVGLPLTLFLLVVVSPVFETLLLAPMVYGLTRLIGPGPAAWTSALAWAAFHSTQGLAWGLVVWWPFLVMATALLTWRGAGLLRALGIVIAIHALQNAVGAAILLLA